jgi:PAS domain S-box-containing protein
MAHFQKIVAYLVPLTALSLYFLQAFRRELSATDRLEEAIGGLRKEISERRQVEKQLRSKELRLDQLTGNIREVFWISIPQSREWIYVSPAYEDIFGRSCESLYQDPWSVLEAIHPDDREEVRSLMEQEVEDDLSLNFRITRPDGQIRWIRTRAFPLQNEEGEVFRVAGISEDVTEQTVTENALRRTEAKNRALLNAIPDLIFRVSRDGVYLDYHARDQSKLRAPPQEFLGKRVWDFFPDLEEEVRKAIEKSLESGALEIIEYPFELHGEQRDYESRFVKSGEDEVTLIVRDITEHKRLEREILEISSREQERIGHDLHDGLSQQLTGIALLGKALTQKLETRPFPEAEDARRIVDLANAAIAQTRSLARGLSPVELEQQGLYAALEELAAGVETLHPVSCRFRRRQDVSVEDHATANHLYRIAQEAVTNALKHAAPSRIEIELQKDDGTYTLKIQDNGKGLPQDSSRSNGMGFHIMQYRARMIDASLTIEDTPGKGTTVTCKLVNKETEQRHKSNRQMKLG